MNKKLYFLTVFLVFTLLLLSTSAVLGSDYSLFGTAPDTSPPTAPSISLTQEQSWRITNISDTELFYDIESVSYDGNKFSLNLKAVNEIKNISNKAIELPDGKPITLKPKEEAIEENKTKEIPKGKIPMGNPTEIMPTNETVNTIEELKTKLLIASKDYELDNSIKTIDFFEEYNRTTGLMNYSFKLSADYRTKESVEVCDENGQHCVIELIEVKHTRDEVVLKLGGKSIYVTAVLDTDMTIQVLQPIAYNATIDVSAGELIMNSSVMNKTITLSSSPITYDVVSNTNTSVVVNIPEVGTDIFFTPTYISLESFRSSDKDGGNNGLVASYNFDYPTGSIAFDSSGNGNDGTIVNALWSEDTHNNTGSCLYFDGAGDYVDCGDDASLNLTEEITVTGWISTTSIVTQQGIYSSVDGNPRLAIDLKLSKLRFFAYPNDGSDYEVYSSILESNKWYHIVCVYSVSEGRTTLYINGTMDGNESRSKSLGRLHTNMRIGDYNNAEFVGTIDNVNIYNRALSATEIADQYSNDLPKYTNVTFNTTDASWFNQETVSITENYLGESNLTRVRINNPFAVGIYDLYLLNLTEYLSWSPNDLRGIWYDSYTGSSDNSTLKATTDYSQWVDTCNAGNTTGQVACWNFNELYGTSAHDRANNSANNNDGTLTGMNTGKNNGSSGWNDNGKFGGGIDFDGVNDYVDCGNDASLNISDEITITAWIKLDDASGDNKIVSRHASSPEYGYVFGVHGGDLKFYVSDNGTEWTSGQIDGTTTFTDDLWYSVIARYNSSYLSLYVNGQSDKTPVAYSDGLHISSASLKIGSDPWNHFNGTIDEVKIFNVAKDQAWITAEYNRGRERLDSITRQEGAISAGVNQDYLLTNGTIDSTPPQITIQQPPSSNTTINWFNITASDTNNISSCWFSINDGTSNQTLSNSSGNWNYQNASLEETTHNVTFWCNDTVGNENNAVREFTYDVTYPQIDFADPTDTDNTNTTNNYTYINWSITETNRDTVLLNWNGTNTTMTNDYLNKTALSEGTYTYYVWVNDTAGNANQTDTRTITIDWTNPTITVSSPVNTTTTDSTPLFNVSFDDTVNLTYSIDGGTNTSACTYCASYLADGAWLSSTTHNITYYAINMAGLTSESSVTWTITDTGVGGPSPAPPEIPPEEIIEVPEEPEIVEPADIWDWLDVFLDTEIYEDEGVCMVYDWNYTQIPLDGLNVSVYKPTGECIQTLSITWRPITYVAVAIVVFLILGVLWDYGTAGVGRKKLENELIRRKYGLRK